MELKERANEQIKKSQKARPAGDRNTNVVTGTLPQTDASGQQREVKPIYLSVFKGEKKME
jgi:hypothetical protein